MTIRRNGELPVNASQLSLPESKHSQPYLTGWLAKQTMVRSLMRLESIELSQVAVNLEYYESRASRKKNCCHDLNQLCQVFKDHKNLCLMQLVESSYQHCLG